MKGSSLRSTGRGLRCRWPLNGYPGQHQVDDGLEDAFIQGLPRKEESEVQRADQRLYGNEAVYAGAQFASCLSSIEHGRSHA